MNSSSFHPACGSIYARNELIHRSNRKPYYPPDHKEACRRFKPGSLGPGPARAQIALNYFARNAAILSPALPAGSIVLVCLLWMLLCRHAGISVTKLVPSRCLIPIQANSPPAKL